MTQSQTTHINQPKTPTFTWDPADVDAAFKAHMLFQTGGMISDEDVVYLQQLASKHRRAARTIAEISMGSMMTVPRGVEDAERLPAPDAVLLQSTLENWPGMSPDDAEGVAHEHISDLNSLYDLDAIFENEHDPVSQYIGAGILHPSEAVTVAKRLGQLITNGQAETPLARGLSALMLQHTQREHKAQIPIDQITTKRQELGLDRSDVARRSELDDARLRDIEAGVATADRDETRRLVEVINRTRHDPAAAA